MPYTATKTYGHERGLSCCFRQWRAQHSHCQFMHGYALSFDITFGCLELDANGWVMDFGALSEVKKFLEDTFDHKTVVAQDDPHIATFHELAHQGLIQMIVVESTGCEAFARFVFTKVTSWLKVVEPRCWVAGVTVREHGSNAAHYAFDVEDLINEQA